MTFLFSFQLHLSVLSFAVCPTLSPAFKVRLAAPALSAAARWKEVLAQALSLPQTFAEILH